MMKWIVFSLVCAIAVGCGRTEEVVFGGAAQGTTYMVKAYLDSTTIEQEEIDKLLLDFDFAVSTYNPASQITTYNKADTFIRIVDTTGFFSNVYYHGFRFQKLTNGYFNPGLEPLFQALKENDSLTAEERDSLIALGRMDDNKVMAYIDSTTNLLTLDLWKDSEEQLGFNASAQGLSVDYVADFLEHRGIRSYLVEIGGEMKVGAPKPDGSLWRVGVEAPAKDRTGTMQHILELKNKSIATSGTYRKFIAQEGKQVPHILNPLTGLAVDHNLVSVTVITDNCGDADALATAFLAMGKEKTLLWKQEHLKPEVEIVFIEQTDSGFVSSYTEGVNKWLLENE